MRIRHCYAEIAVTKRLPPLRIFFTSIAKHLATYRYVSTLTAIAAVTGKRILKL
jgi:hypothetical protein